MPGLNFPLVTDWMISVVTAPAAPPGASAPVPASFSFQVQIILQSGPSVFLRVETLDEFNAIVAVLQTPVGRLHFNPQGQTLIRSLF